MSRSARTPLARWVAPAATAALAACGPSPGNIDLRPTITLDPPPQAIKGASLAGRVHVTVVNDGTTAATATGTDPLFRYIYVLSSDEIVEMSEVVTCPPTAWVEDCVLPGGDETTPGPIGAESTFTVPDDTDLTMFTGVPSGDYFLCVRIDVDDQVPDRRMDDDVACTPIAIVDPPLPPLCIGFEQGDEPGESLGAVADADATSLWAGDGVTFTAHPAAPDASAGAPKIVSADSSFVGMQGLVQPDCAGLDIHLSPRLDARSLTVSVRVPGLIGTPNLLTATAYADDPPGSASLARVEVIHQSTPGDLRPTAELTVATPEPMRVLTLTQGLCPPLLQIDELCVGTTRPAPSDPTP